MRCVCRFCSEPVDVRSAYQLVIGWENPSRGAAGKSGSSLVLRKHMQEWACAPCITKQRAGFVQGTLDAA